MGGPYRRCMSPIPVDEQTDELSDDTDKPVATSVSQSVAQHWLGVWLRRQGPADI